MPMLESRRGWGRSVTEPALNWTSEAIAKVLEERRFADLATVVAAPATSAVTLGTKILVDRDGQTTGTLGNDELDRAVAADARTAMDERRSQVASYPEPGGMAQDSEVLVFHEVLEPQPQLLIVGAGHIAAPL